MANPPGVRLTARDETLLQYLALARYLKAAHLAALLQHRSSHSNVARRLRQLAEPVNGRALVRALGAPSEGSLWTVTPAGWDLATGAAPTAPKPAARDLTTYTEHHQALVADILVGLVLGVVDGDVVAPAELPFRWHPEAEEDLTFKMKDRDGFYVSASVKPDALVEMPAARRRLFIELETGARHVGVTSGTIHNTTALMRKLRRYAAYFGGIADAATGRSWYAARFHDDLEPEVVLAVHSTQRRDAVRLAMKRWMGPTSRLFRIRVLTQDEAPGALAALVRAGPVPPGRVFTLPDHLAVRLRERVNELIAAVNAHRDVLEEHNRLHPEAPLRIPPLSVSGMKELTRLLRHELFGEAKDQVPWAVMQEDPPSRAGPARSGRAG